MPWYLLAGLVLLSTAACNKSNKDKPASGPAAVISEEADSLLVQIDADFDQWVSLSSFEGLEDVVLFFPAGSLSASAQILIKQDYDILADEDLQLSLGLDEAVSILEKKPTILLEARLPADGSISLDSPLYWQTSQAEAGWSMLALEDRAFTEDGEERQRVLVWKQAAETPDPQTTQFALEGLGSFQLLKTDLEGSEEPIIGSAGSGSWWGYDIDLFHSTVEPASTEVSLWQVSFNQVGDIRRYFTDGEQVTLLPGLSFDVSKTEYPLIYDSSDSQVLFPWIWSKRSLYGVIFTITEGNQTLYARILQRRKWPKIEFPSALDPEELVGNYSGLALSFPKTDGKPKAKPKAEPDLLEISYAENKLQLNGRLADYNDISANINWSELKGLAGQLGIAKTSLSVDGRQMPLTIFVSLDRRAIGYILCREASETACGDGTGGGGLDPFAFDYGMLEREP